ncbi:MAG: hypothetical protein A3G34_04880 [Candidatus Lindowbacteria bacterium RIFCSPLOWO2_12_FULL_62_27]|nr:MAG: hypothetical protein A3I06_13200 [Candidatus Lindowbacteria bacterium RIFCSPLOWO2_02_FULL_62_12]OGH61332.1 MAG: hypothetical protein A3G34_04880 [Candidatus Lindowbacteria bacterium RIFCSPLOWO2_12_FULL_62_27]
MKKGRGSISGGKTYKQIGEFWDTHDLGDYWARTRPASFEVDLQAEMTYCPLERDLSKKIRSIAQRQGVTPDTLVNLWLQEKVQTQVQEKMA